MPSITLFCLAHGDLGSRAFPVRVNSSATVDELKELIKARRYNGPANTDVVEITLWQVNIPADRFSALLPGFDLHSQGTELFPFAEIQDIFPNPARNCLHIIIEPQFSPTPHSRVKFPPPQANHRRTISNVTGVIIGMMGTGKTTLVNLICGVNHPAGAGGSFTNILYKNSVSCGDHPFTLIDTPGSSSKDENYKHSLLQFHALTAAPINAILMMVKYDCRHVFVRSTLDDLLKLVPEHKKKVVIVVSHWDHAQDQDREFEQMWKAVRGAGCANMIVYSKKNKPEQVASMIYDCISQLSSETLKIDESTFLVRFDIFTKVGDLAEAYNSFDTEAKKLHLEYKELLADEITPSLNPTIQSHNDEAIHSLIVQHRQDLEIIEQKFHRLHGENMVELNHYAFYVQMQKLSLRLSTDFATWAAKSMSYSLNDAQDPRNLIKQCPNCNLIWFKTEGCDGSTQCGNRGFSINADVLSKASYRFKVSIVNGRRRLNGPFEIPKINPVKNSTVSTQGVGCHATFNWRSLPKIPDEKILELFQVDSIEKAKEFCKRSDFAAVRNNYERNIDREFYS